MPPGTAVWLGKGRGGLCQVGRTLGKLSGWETEMGTLKGASWALLPGPSAPLRDPHLVHPRGVGALRVWSCPHSGTFLETKEPRGLQQTA